MEELEPSVEPLNGPRTDGCRSESLPGHLVAPAEDAVDLAEQARVFGALFPTVAAEKMLVGRFELQHRLGRGGMGEVYVAYDEQLDRRVALKLLLRERSADAHARDRMLREAQVLARLSHPNVVQIHEAGIHEDQVFLAMELVNGVTLREWLSQHPPGAVARPWREVLPVMIEAGQGLAAAHAAGLTHRDFKPDNVLVGSDGRVRVLDFGLARPGTETDEPDEPDEPTTISKDEPPSTSGTRMTWSARSGARREIAQLTEPGQVVGTLAYMSPEQLAARPLDDRTDQFSFCVTLFEALYGKRPFEGRTLAAFLIMVSQGMIEEPASRSLVPRWLHQLVRRGLSANPEDRFADMESLLRELSRARGRRWAMGLSAGAMLLAGAGMASVLGSGEAPCEQADAELVSRWDDEARERVREAFVAAAPAYGADVAERTIASLDIAVDGWRTEQVDACEDTRVRQTHTEELLTRRAACIERNTELLEALLRALPQADAGLVEHAYELVEALPGPVRCQDLDELGPDVPEDPEAVGRVREALAEVEVLRLGGQEPLAEADRALAIAEATGYGPVHAEALVEAARSRGESPRREEHEQLSEMLWKALDLTERHDHDALRFEIWLGLLDLDWRRGHHERARLWARRAEVSLEHGPTDPRLRLELAVRRGMVELSAGDLPRAEQWLRQGLDDAATIPGSGLAEARLFEALGTTLRRGARGPEAREAYEQAGQRWREHLGPEHPYLAQHAFNVGLLLMELGDLPAARERLMHAHARWTALYGPQVTVVGQAELALANLDQTTGALDQALAHATRGLAILSASTGPGARVQGEAHQVLGLVQFRRGELQAAHDAWQQALESLLAKRSPDDPEVLLTRSNLAEALLGLGRHAEARATYEEILPAVQAQGEQDPVGLMLVLKGLGLAELGDGRPAAAMPWLREALALCERGGGLPLEQADLQWGLARAEHGAGEPWAGARERAAEAAGVYAEHGQAERAKEIEGWLVVKGP